MIITKAMALTALQVVYSIDTISEVLFVNFLNDMTEITRKLHTYRRGAFSSVTQQGCFRSLIAMRELMQNLPNTGGCVDE